MSSLVPLAAFGTLLDCLRDSHDLPTADQALLHQALRYRTLPAGRYLCQPGQVCEGLFFVCQGVLRVVTPLGQGQELTYFFAQENQFCTVLDSFLHQRTALEGLQAACPTRVLVLPHRVLHRLYQQLPYLQSLLDRLLQDHLVRSIEQRNQVLHQPLATRYQQLVRSQPALVQRVSTAVLHSYLGLTI